MIRIETYPPGEPPERNPAIEGFIYWRGKMEEMRTSKRRDMIGLMLWYNHMADYRRKLAPWEWISCPDCGGRGLWVDNGNHWCLRCGGTSILLTEELTDLAEISLVRRTAPPPDWGSLWPRVERRPVMEPKVEGASLDAIFWNNKGGDLGNQGHYEEALFCYDKALELNPHKPEVWVSKGTSLANLCCFEEALFCYDKALELDQHYANALNNKGSSLANLGRFEEAIQCFNKTLKFDSSNGFALEWKNINLNLVKMTKK